MTTPKNSSLRIWKMFRVVMVRRKNANTAERRSLVEH